MTRARIIVLILCIVGVLVCAFVPSRTIYSAARSLDSIPTKTNRVADGSVEEDRQRVQRQVGERNRKIESYLKERGRSAVNLLAADLLCPHQDEHSETPYREELSSMRDDANAMMISATNYRKNDALRRLREINPENAYARYLCAGESGRGENHLQIAVDEMRIACTRPTYHTPWPELETAFLDLATYLDGDVQGWTRLAAYQESVQVIDPRDGALDTWFRCKAWVDDPLSGDVFSVGWEFAKIAERNGDTVTALRWQKLMLDASTETIQQLTGMDRDRFLDQFIQKEKARREKHEGFRNALTVATAEDYTMMETILREKGLHAAQQALLDRIGPAELERLRKERIKNDPFASEE